MPKKKPPAKPKRGRPFSGGRDPARSIRVSDETWSRWKALADAQGKSVSAVIHERMQGA